MFELPPVNLTRVPVNGIDLNCAVAGEGPLLLLLHGFPEFWGSWYHQIPALARHFKVVAVDLRGCGDSHKPEGGYDALTLAADIAGVIDTFAEGKRARIVGHNWGGFIAWALAYRYPERIERMSVINSPHPVLYRRKAVKPSQAFKSWYVLFFTLPWISEWYLRRRGGSGIRAVFRSGAARPEALDPEYVDHAVAKMLKPGAIRGGLQYYRTTVLRGRRNIEFMNGVTQVPVQIIWGLEDSALDPVLLEGVEEYVTHVRIHTLAGVGHWVMHEAPEEVTRLLLEWQTPAIV